MVWEQVDNSLKILGSMSRRELHWLAWNAKNCKVVIEIGTWMGRSAYAMGAFIKRGKVITIDNYLWEPKTRDERSWFERKGIGVPMEVYRGTKDFLYNKCLENLGELIKTGKVEVIKGDCNIVIKDLQGLKGSVDMVFIDGDHSYEGVKKDILNYKPLIRKGGLLCGHDYGTTVKEAVDELLPGAKATTGCIWEYRC